MAERDVAKIVYEWEKDIGTWVEKAGVLLLLLF